MVNVGGNVDHKIDGNVNKRATPDEMNRVVKRTKTVVRETEDQNGVLD